MTTPTALISAAPAQQLLRHRLRQALHLSNQRRGGPARGVRVSNGRNCTTSVISRAHETRRGRGQVADDNPSATRPSGRTQRERRAETERRVLEATVRLIAAGGTGSVSLAQVGTEAGYSRGIVTHQFGSKDELLRRVAEYAQRVFAAPATDERGLDKVLSIVDTYLEYLVKHEPAGRAFLLMWVEAVAQPNLRVIFVDRDENFRSTLTEHLHEGVQEGSVRADVDPSAVAVVLVGQLRGIGLQLMLTPDPVGYDLIRREALALVRRGLERSPAAQATL